MVKQVGEFLKAKRIELGLSIEQVSEALKIRSNYLLYLEKDELNEYLSEVYVVGYIRNYSNLLNLNTEKIVASYKQNANLKSEITGKNIIIDNPKPSIYFIIISIFLSLILHNYSTSDSNSKLGSKYTLNKNNSLIKLN